MKTLMNRRNAAIITGVSLILMALTAGFVMTTFISSIENDQVVETMAYSFGVAGWSLILVLDLIVSVGVYFFFKNVNEKRAAVSSGWRIVYSFILAAGVAFLHIGLVQNMSGNYTGSAFSVSIFKAVWEFGLIVFGVHLITLSKLVCNKKMTQMVLAGLLLFAGIGYMLMNLLSLVVSNYDEYKSTLEMIFMFPMIAGEIGFAFWLIINGGRGASHPAESVYVCG
jgi:hypothetical protein